jgi:hypothetical protein
MKKLFLIGLMVASSLNSGQFNGRECIFTDPGIKNSFAHLKAYRSLINVFETLADKNLMNLILNNYNNNQIIKKDKLIASLQVFDSLEGYKSTKNFLRVKKKEYEKKLSKVIDKFKAAQIPQTKIVAPTQKDFENLLKLELLSIEALKQLEVLAEFLDLQEKKNIGELLSTILNNICNQVALILRKSS